MEAKPKYYHLVIQEPASALRCEVLDCCSLGVTAIVVVPLGVKPKFGLIA
jgi:hypothetical protein